MKLIVAFICVAISLIGCSGVKKHFPDKEKDYQFSSEIPPLAIPEDLKADQASQVEQVIISAPSDSNTVDPIVVEPSVNVQAYNPESESSEVVISDHAEILSYTSGAIRLRISAPIERGWSLVSRAISRQSIEVLERNREENYFSVLYDPNEKPVQDGSLLDEFLFLIGTKYTDEKEYHIRLTPNGLVTEVMVTDQYDNPLSRGPGLSLLRSIAEKINADQDD